MNPIPSAFTIRYSYAYRLSADTDKQETTAFIESEGENISDHCSVRCIGGPTDKQRLEKPANNTCNRTAKTSEIAVL